MLNYATRRALFCLVWHLIKYFDAFLVLRFGDVALNKHRFVVSGPLLVEVTEHFGDEPRLRGKSRESRVRRAHSVFAIL